MSGNFVDERRIGRFDVSWGAFAFRPERFAHVFAGMIIVRAEEKSWDNLISYEAFGPMFDPVELGSKIPEYRAVFTESHDGSLTVSWERLPV